MKNLPKEFKQFCKDRNIELNSAEYSLAKEAWNKAIFLATDIFGEKEGSDDGVCRDYTILEDNEELYSEEVEGVWVAKLRKVEEK